MASDSQSTFDAIVVGSGISGGWAAKELTERGLKVLMLERGRHVTHRQDYVTEGMGNWQLPYRGQIPEEKVSNDYAIQKDCYAFSDFTKHFFVNDREHPYSTPKDKPFPWIRGYHLGGRSVTWHRQSYRLSEMDFEANKLDGYGVDWPIRYADLAPWYDHVETFAGISGSHEGLPQLPDGNFQPPFPMNCVELEIKERVEKAHPNLKMIIGRTAHLTAPTQEQISLGRGRCMNRSECQRGCSFGAYFSSLSATLPAANKTGNLTTVTDAIVDSVNYDAGRKRATGVNVIDANTGARRNYSGRIVFLCASTLGTTQIMLNSKSEAFPNGLANSSGALGHYLMDHIGGINAWGTVKGHDDKYTSGRRATECYFPRFRNISEKDDRFLRGYGFQGGAERKNWQRNTSIEGIGAEFKQALRKPGPWEFRIQGFGEMLPLATNRVTLDENNRDKWGIPILKIDCEHGENDLALLDAMEIDARAIVESAGVENVQVSAAPMPPGLLIHEMGTARMGRDPATSVLNKYNQAHDVPNLFVTDGSCMTSAGCQNPSLTYMAITARASTAAADMLKEGAI